MRRLLLLLSGLIISFLLSILLIGLMDITWNGCIGDPVKEKIAVVKAAFFYQDGSVCCTTWKCALEPTRVSIEFIIENNCPTPQKDLQCYCKQYDIMSVE